MAETLEQCAAQAGAGDVDAADMLLRRLHSRIFSLIHARGVNPADMDDMAQRVAIQVLKSLGKYSPSLPFLPWFYSIARNETSKYWRSLTRETKRMDIVRKDLMISIEVAEAEDDDVREVSVRGLTDCMEKIQGRQRRILEMRYYERISSQTIASRVKMKAGTVRNILFRVRAALRACVEGYVEARMGPT